MLMITAYLELRAAKKELKKCHEELEVLRENGDNRWEVVKGSQVKSKPKDKSKGKRKPGFSLVNPSVKRYGACPLPVDLI